VAAHRQPAIERPDGPGAAMTSSGESGSAYREFYRGRRVMITGGLGFIGSNLCRQLVALGADVLLVDSLIPDYGGNLFNINGVESRVRVNVADVRQQSTMNYLVRDREVIFNLAGQVSHIDSMKDPYSDLEINCRSQLTILEACRYRNPAARVVFAGTRQIYGHPDSLPVTEKHLVRPTDVNGINKAAGEYYHLVYNNVFHVRACSLRLTNVYGPRQLIRHDRQGFIGWFIRLALEDRTIQIYGDGSQLRDFVYVDDAADAFLRAGASDACNGEVFNVGGDGAVSHRDLTALLLEVAGAGRVEYVEWPAEKKAIDIGDFYADSSKFMQATGWAPTTSLREGLTRTLAFYREHARHYVGDSAGGAATA
jgi:UDP-glucose 4-epimerase